MTLLVVEERIKDNGVRISDKIAGIKDPLFDTFKNGKNDNLIQIRRAKLLLKGRESSFRRNVVDNRIETDAFSKGRVTLKKVNQLPYCKPLDLLNEDSLK